MSKLIEVKGVAYHVKLNLTADHWQLYRIDGREDAARRMNREIEELLLQGKLNDLHKVLEKYSKFGAADTEGYDTVALILDTLNIDSRRFI
jgi:hypothetical protein